MAINTLHVVNCQSPDSILYLINHGQIKDDLKKFNLLCRLASNSVDYDTIIKYSDQAISLAEKLNINPSQAYVYKGFGCLNSGKLAAALECFMKAAKYYEADKNRIGLAATYTYITEAYVQQENFNNAKYYLKNAVAIFREEEDTIKLASALHNLGYTNYSMGQYDTALVLFTETGKIYQKMGNLTEYAFCLGNSGLVYSRQSQYQKAEEYLLRAIEILNNQGDERAVTQFMIEYAAILQHKGKINDGIATAKSGFYKAKKNNYLEFQRDGAYRLSKLYQISARYDSAFFYQTLYLNANDSIKSFKNIQKMADLRTEFEVARKQSEVEVLEKNKLIQLIVIIGLGLILLLALGIILLYYYSLKRSKRMTAVLDERRILLEKQSLELKEQREVLRQQKEEIISSINYAKYIQSSILPQEEQLESLLGEHFVLYKPKDIVSGDFYWISNIENKTVLAAADCTGHGVPGAFMSMLGMALLNEIVNKEYITHPGVILRHLRKEVIHSLQQKGERGEQKDGMDIALCTLDPENMKLQFAGANNPLYLIRKANLPEVGLLRCESGGDDRLYEIKGDLMPIGINDKMANFTFHEIDIFKGDTFYLFSDGFPDQFDSRNIKKFGYRKFREQLLKNNSKSIAESKIILEKVLSEWMGENSQIDDIMVIGFRIR
ncbi:MAG: tetratricopeptide repeat protein [Bacteroidetes bacterium]|nr:tetratricopeptide repeat protein [Bacteroidota bacterium]